MAGMRGWLADHPQGRFGEHRPDAAEYGLEPGRIRERFATYYEHFGERSLSDVEGDDQ